MGDVEATFEKGMLSGQRERADQLRQYLTVDSLFEEIKQASESMGAKRVVIDPITSVIMLSDSEVVSRMQIMWLTQKLRKINVTTLATLEEGIGFWRDVLFLSDGVVYMMLKEKEGVFQRGLVVEKMRGTPHDTGVRPIKITGKGITVYSDEVLIR
jgi:KaiC/GvpD/RAD55 family RecA-like ATPase